MFETKWRSPSNIAFVKYWGKKGHQIPSNPSVSMTLKDCYTETSVKFSSCEKLCVELSLEGKSEERFGAKIMAYLERLDRPELKNIRLQVQTRNTFPHGAGIASSASGLSAFALCLTDYLFELQERPRDALFYQEASDLSRLASGSACRSIYGGFTTWGESALSGSSDRFSTPLEVHESLTNLHDTVLIISDAEKSISSSKGHERMSEHGYASARFIEAKKNFSLMISALKTGDLEGMGLVLENEALQLHAMMMTSPESFTLLRPNSLLAIEMVRAFRNETKLPLYFTLDAGPNLHLIYPPTAYSKVQAFITHELGALGTRIIDDQRGEGPIKCL
jgi:diphosphomevalonate decarboxylase